MKKKPEKQLKNFRDHFVKKKDDKNHSLSILLFIDGLIRTARVQ